MEQKTNQRVRKAVQSAAKPETKQQVKPATRTRSSAQPVYVFIDGAPSAGHLLRAYFLALITTQLGKLVAGRPFKLPRAMNVRTHVQNKILDKVNAGTYKLTPDGVQKFAHPDAQPPEEMLAQMVEATKTGVSPSCYAHRMKVLSE